MYTCRECERPINQATEICPYCGADLTVPVLPEEEPAKKPNLAKTLLRWSVLIAAMWAFLWFVLPEKKGDTAARSETVAIEALRETRVALAEFADARGGGFPTSLEAVANRVRSVAQKAQGEGYHLEYFPDLWTRTARFEPMHCLRGPEITVTETFMRTKQAWFAQRVKTARQP